MQTTSREQNTEFNRSEFFSRLAELQPESIVDIGCGSGDMLARCAAAGIEATGVEPSAPEDSAADRHIIKAPAEKLPFEDGAFDWAVMRFVPHHLAVPAEAFAEALRVCRSGFLVAEPWFDTSLASQRTSLELDRWMKQQDRRGGMVHEEVLSAGDLIAALPAGHEYEITMDTSLQLREWKLEDVEAEVESLLKELAADHEDLVAFDRLRASMKTDRVSWNGSVFVVARRQLHLGA